MIHDSLLQDIKKKLDEDGVVALFAYLALVENLAPFMLSGAADSLQKKDADNATDQNSLEYQMEVNELKEFVALFLSRGFSKEETKSTLLDMANYRHLRQEII